MIKMLEQSDPRRWDDCTSYHTMLAWAWHWQSRISLLLGVANSYSLLLLSCEARRVRLWIRRSTEHTYCLQGRSDTQEVDRVSVSQSQSQPRRRRGGTWLEPSHLTHQEQENGKTSLRYFEGAAMKSYQMPISIRAFEDIYCYCRQQDIHARRMC